MLDLRTTASLSLALVFASVLPATASAQVIIQGEVTAQPAQGQVQGQIVVQGQGSAYVQQPYVDPNGQTVYVDPNAQSAYAQPMMPQCPPPAQLMPNRWGQQQCMQQVTTTRVSGGLLGGGIGLLAGGYVLEVFVTLFTGIVGAFDTSGTYSASALENYVTFGFIPLIGPWVQMGFAPPFADASLYAVLALEGLAQAGGLVMIIFGAMGQEVTEWRPIAGLDLRVAPVLGMSTQGLSAQLSF